MIYQGKLSKTGTSHLSLYKEFMLFVWVTVGDIGIML